MIARTESCVTFRDAEPMFRLSFSRVRRPRKKGGEAVETDISFSFILEVLVSRSPGRCRYKITQDKITHSKSPTQNHPGQNHPP